MAEVAFWVRGDLDAFVLVLKNRIQTRTHASAKDLSDSKGVGDRKPHLRPPRGETSTSFIPSCVVSSDKPHKFTMLRTVLPLLVLGGADAFHAPQRLTAWSRPISLKSTNDLYAAPDPDGGDAEKAALENELTELKGELSGMLETLQALKSQQAQQPPPVQVRHSCWVGGWFEREGGADGAWRAGK